MFRQLAFGWAILTTASAWSVLHESRGELSSRTLEKSPTYKHAVVPVRLAVTQRNLDRGYDHVMDVADPKSKSYGKHWTVDEVRAEFAPAAESVNLIVEWLRSSGLKDARPSSDGSWIAFDAAISDLERVFKTTYYEYASSDGTIRVGSDRYYLPEHITKHVDYVVPGVKLSAPLRKRTMNKRVTTSDPPRRPAQIPSPVHGSVAHTFPTSNTTDNCGKAITPACWRALYGIPLPSALGVDIQSGDIGVFEDGVAYSQSDLNKYFAKYANYVPQGTHPTVVSINGGVGAVTPNNTLDGGEADLDLDIVYSLLGNVPVTMYATQTPDGAEDLFATLVDPFLDAIDGSFCDAREKEAGFQCGVANLTTVVSMSYGAPELFYQTLPSQQRACNEMLKLSLQGHTFVVSSGDYGVASNPGFSGTYTNDCANGCIPRDLKGRGRDAFLGPIFSPQFPATCPYVLAVGATQLQANGTAQSPEQAMNVPMLSGSTCTNGPAVNFSSSGGFSNYFRRPAYQGAAVSGFLAEYAPDYPTYKSNYVAVTDNTTTIGSSGGLYNLGGRAYPDVSANGAQMPVYVQSMLSPYFGTSLAAPIWASILTIINAQRAAVGLSSVGFVNPALYASPEAFHDIVEGSNGGCGTDGFPAVPGWDPVTGLGTPNFPVLSELFLGF